MTNKQADPNTTLISTGDYCVTDTLNSLQNKTGTNVSVSFLTSLLTGDTSTFQTAINTGYDCTGCVQGYGCLDSARYEF